MPRTVKFDPSRPSAIRLVRAAIREDRDISATDYRVAKWVIDRQMDMYHSLAFTFLAYVPGTAFGLAAGLNTHNQMWARAFWLACALTCLITIPRNVIRRMRTERWVSSHELIEII